MTRGGGSNSSATTTTTATAAGGTAFKVRLQYKNECGDATLVAKNNFGQCKTQAQQFFGLTHVTQDCISLTRIRSTKQVTLNVKNKETVGRHLKQGDVLRINVLDDHSNSNSSSSPLSSRRSFVQEFFGRNQRSVRHQQQQQSQLQQQLDNTSQSASATSASSSWQRQRERAPSSPPMRHHHHSRTQSSDTAQLSTEATDPLPPPPSPPFPTLQPLPIQRERQESTSTVSTLSTFMHPIVTPASPTSQTRPTIRYTMEHDEPPLQRRSLSPVANRAFLSSSYTSSQDLASVASAASAPTRMDPPEIKSPRQHFTTTTTTTSSSRHFPPPSSTMYETPPSPQSPQQERLCAVPAPLRGMIMQPLEPSSPARALSSTRLMHSASSSATALHNPTKPVRNDKQQRQGSNVSVSSAPAQLQQGTPLSAAAAADTKNSPTPIRSDYKCPIMMHLMADPVQDADGCTFDRETIERYFAQQVEDHAEQQSQASWSQSSVVTATTGVVHTCPLTRQVITTQLIPIKSLENMIVEDVEQERIVLSVDELESWKQRRAAKKKRDKQRLQNARVPLAAPGIQVPHYPVTLLSRLVRLDRPSPALRYDSGLSVALASADERNDTAPKYCSVTCCVTRFDARTPSTFICWCHRCQRAVCPECWRVEVSEFGQTLFAPKAHHHVCIDCVVQMADVLYAFEQEDMERARFTSIQQAMDMRERLHRNYVAPRLERMAQRARDLQQDTVRAELFQASACSEVAAEIPTIQEKLVEIDDLIKAKKIKFDETYERSWEKFQSLPEATSHFDFLRDGLEKIFAADVTNAVKAHSETRIRDVFSWQPPCAGDHADNLLEALRVDETAQLPLNLSFPSPGMRQQLQGLLRRLEARAQECRPLIETEVLQEEMKLESIRDELATRLSCKKKQLDGIKRLTSMLKQLTKAFAQIQKLGTTAEVSASLIADELGRAVPDEQPSDSLPDVRLFMCSNCGTGLAERPPSGGCSQCKTAADSWEDWDGRGWF